MQTRFAKIEMVNHAFGERVFFLAACLGNRFTMQQIKMTTARIPTMRLGAENDARVAPMVSGACGTVDDPQNAFVEIGMLIKRYVKLGSTASSDVGADWAVGSTVPMTFHELVIVDNRGLMSGFEMSLAKLFRTHETFGRAIRLSHVLANMRAAATLQGRVNGHRNVAYAAVWSGLLAVNPGVRRWGHTYTPFDILAYQKRSTLRKTVGSLIGKCLHASNEGLPYAGLRDELHEVLQDPENAELMPLDMKEKIAPLVSTLGRFRLAQCHHFDLSDRLRNVVEDGGTRLWCANCYSHDSVTVVDLQQRWARDYAYWSDSHDAYYSYDIDTEEGGHEFEDDSRSILDYSTNVTKILQTDPNIRSSPFGEFLMGIELELTVGEYSRNAAAKEIRKRLGNDYCVIKNDGSLPTGGIEIVTAPRGLVEHITRFDGWTIDPSYRAWDTNQCGMHVHLHSRAFTEMSLGKFLMFINLDTNAPFLRKLAGRHPMKDPWAARFCAQEGMEIMENPKSAVKGKSRERYRMVNTQNLSKGEAERLGLDPYSYSGKYDTVELRVFKASLKKDRLLAQIEFTHAAVMFCRVASYRDLTGKTFLQWLQPHTRLYPHLADWFGARKSKATKDAGAATLEEKCTDTVVGDMVVPPRAVRATRPRPPRTNINQYLTPRARREAEAAALEVTLQTEREALRVARERVFQRLTAAGQVLAEEETQFRATTTARETPF